MSLKSWIAERQGTRRAREIRAESDAKEAAKIWETNCFEAECQAIRDLIEIARRKGERFVYIRQGSGIRSVNSEGEFMRALAVVGNEDADIVAIVPVSSTRGGYGSVGTEGAAFITLRRAVTLVAKAA